MADIAIPRTPKPDHSAEPYVTFKAEFETTIPATALLFSNKHEKALRVECPTIAMEFIDKLHIGHDPEGFLCYHAIEDFEMQKHDGTPVTHRYNILRLVHDEKVYIVIEYRRDSDEDCYAKFVAQDHTDSVTAADMVDHSSTGEWGKLVRGSSSATVVKKSSESHIAIYADSIGIVGHWTPGGHELNHKHFTVKGTIYYELISEIQSGNHANFSPDRIVFYKDHWNSENITSYFIPLEIETEQLPYKTVFSGVKWAEIPEEKREPGASDPDHKCMIA